MNNEDSDNGWNKSDEYNDDDDDNSEDDMII